VELAKIGKCVVREDEVNAFWPKNKKFKVWMAKIGPGTGRYRYDRTFCERSFDYLDSEIVSGVTFKLNGRGMYQFNGFIVNFETLDHKNGYFFLRDDGSFVECDTDDFVNCDGEFYYLKRGEVPCIYSDDTWGEHPFYLSDLKKKKEHERFVSDDIPF